MEITTPPSCVPWNKGKLVGQKAPFKLKETTAREAALRGVLSRDLQQDLSRTRVLVSPARITSPWASSTSAAFIKGALTPLTVQGRALDVHAIFRVPR
jgi:hypothetical protein